MSLIQRTKQGFLRLPFLKQLVLVSSLGLMISTVMPWYDERNSFGIGETYLGIQGPFFLIGFIVLGLGAVSFSRLFLPLTGRHFFKAKKTGLLSFFMGLQSLILLVVANSVFYHPDFGANISTKSTRFGMTVAFVSLGIMIFAGWLARNKEESVSEEVFSDPVAQPMTRAAASESVDVPIQSSFSQPVRPVTSPSNPTGAPYGANSVDPLSLDPRTRYKLMQNRMKQDLGQQQEDRPANFWGAARSNSVHYGGSSTIHAEPSNRGEPNRMDI